jgi:signal transduction histidine kinase
MRSTNHVKATTYLTGEDLPTAPLREVGLFAALRWQMKSMGRKSKITCVEHFPALEPPIASSVANALFTIGHEGLILAESQPQVSVVDFTITVDAESIWMRVSSDGALEDLTEANYASAMDRLHQYVRSIGGRLTTMVREGGWMYLCAQIPLVGPAASPGARISK